MAISSYATANITSTDTFQDWINETNNIIGDMATRVMTTDTTASGGQTTGNAAISGVFSADELVATTALRGGSVATSGPLNITSLCNITANTNLYGVQTTINSPTLLVGTATTLTMNGHSTFDGPTKNTSFNNSSFSVTSNTASISANTATISATNGLGITGTTTVAGNISGYTVSANTVAVTNNITANNITLSTKITSANAAITTISGTGLTYTNGTIATINATNLTVGNTINGSISGNAATVTGGVYLTGTQSITGTKTFSALKTSATVLPSANNNHNIGSSTLQYANMYAVTFNGTATKALYADLAERYIADEVYEVGTVISVGGEYEVTAADTMNAHSVLGVVSENPAYLMNEGLEGGTAIALKGRVPVKVIGTVNKGDRLAPSATRGYAEANNDKTAWSFAIALNSNENGMVEAIIL